MTEGMKRCGEYEEMWYVTDCEYEEMWYVTGHRL